jgi:hypothetical protein
MGELPAGVVREYDEKSALKIDEQDGWALDALIGGLREICRLMRESKFRILLLASFVDCV